MTNVPKKRWMVLAIFVFYAAGNSFQWVEYSIVTNIVTKYYNVSPMAVDWTAIIYLIIYPIIVVPASYIINTQGLRTTALIGGLMTALAAIIKVCSIRQDLFWVVLLGQGFGSTAQVFILCLPPNIAAVWFKPSKVSLANSLGVFGSQLGFGLGFLVPTLIVKDSDDLNSIGADLGKMCWILAIFMVPVTTAIVFFFPAAPPLPTNLDLDKKRTAIQKLAFKKFCSNFVEIIKIPGLALQMMAYGINIGTFSALTTFLNQFVLQYFKGGEQDAGRMGLLLVGIGMVGTILFGIILDKTHKYKETNLFVCYMGAASLLAMAVTLKFRNLVCTYLTCMLVGFFVNSYWAIGIELGVELTFPADESTTTGILSAMSQGVGVVITWGMGPFNQRFGAFWGMVALAALLLVGAFLTQAVPNVKKRQDAFETNTKEKEALTSDVI